MATDEGLRIDPATVAALYAAHADELRAFLIGVLRNGDLAQDVVQVTFGKLVEIGHTAREETLKGWLFRVAYHEALVIRRRQAVDQRSRSVLGTLLHREGESPERESMQRDNVRKVRQALEQLAPDQRIIVQKKIYEEKTFAVIASELRLPLGTVLTRMRAALRNLKTELKADE